jgi:outer membrane protein assembly factor BamE (lipoprotein component of BamABCDE complex)
VRSLKLAKFATAALIAACAGACAIQRAELAADARTKMVGMTKEQVLACMGPPMNKAVEGATEVWSYNSGNDHTSVAFGRGWGVAQRRSCTVNVTMVGGRISQMNYVGATGGLLTPGEQCAFALQNCIVQ